MVVLGEESSKPTVASKVGNYKLQRESETELFGMAQKRVFERVLQTESKRQAGQGPMEYNYVEVTCMVFIINFSARPGAEKTEEVSDWLLLVHLYILLKPRFLCALMMRMITMR